MEILELLPLSLEELKIANGRKKRDQWTFDGFMPRLYNNGPKPESLYADYFRTYVERDVRQLANLRNLRQFKTFIRLLAVISAGPVPSSFQESIKDDA